MIAHALIWTFFCLHFSIVFSFFFDSFSTVVIPSLIGLDVSDHIDIGSVNVLKSTSSWVETDSHCFVDTRDFDSVAWLNIVYQVFVSTQMNGLWCFAFRDALWSFLDFDVLLIGEHALVVNDLERVTLLAVLTEGWLLDSPHLHDSFLLSSTFYALELSLLHLGHNITVTNDNSSKCDQLVDMVLI